MLQGVCTELGCRELFTVHGRSCGVGINAGLGRNSCRAPMLAGGTRLPAVPLTLAECCAARRCAAARRCRPSPDARRRCRPAAGRVAWAIPGVAGLYTLYVLYALPIGIALGCACCRCEPSTANPSACCRACPLAVPPAVANACARCAALPPPPAAARRSALLMTRCSSWRSGRLGQVCVHVNLRLDQMRWELFSCVDG